MWLAENFRLNVGYESNFYEMNYAYEEEFGRLYTWEAAQKACPKGWHLPTDDEWWNMISEYGKVYNTKLGKPTNQVHEQDQAALAALAGKGSPSGFDALMGGGVMGDTFFNIFELGLFWGSTVKDGRALGLNIIDIGDDNAWGYNFSLIDGRIIRNPNSKLVGRSVRYVKD